jgi:hypothetical protein
VPPSTGIFHSPEEFLQRVASGKTGAAPDLRIKAKALLAAGDKGFNWDHVTTQVGNFKDGKSRAPWAGLVTDHGDGHNIWLNLDAAHQRGITETYLHELEHPIDKAKIDSYLADPENKKGVLSPTEKGALDRLESDRIKNLRLSAQEKGIEETDPAKLSTMAREWTKEDRAYGGLTNLHEFVNEIKSSPDFRSLLGRLGGGEGKEGSKIV